MGQLPCTPNISDSNAIPTGIDIERRESLGCAIVGPCWPPPHLAGPNGTNQDSYQGINARRLRVDDAIPESERNSDVLRETQLLADEAGSSSGIKPVLDVHLGFHYQFSKFANVSFGLTSTHWFGAGDSAPSPPTWWRSGKSRPTAISPPTATSSRSPSFRAEAGCPRGAIALSEDLSHGPLHLIALADLARSRSLAWSPRRKRIRQGEPSAKERRKAAKKEQAELRKQEAAEGSTETTTTDAEVEKARLEKLGVEDGIAPLEDAKGFYVQIDGFHVDPSGTERTVARVG